MAPALNQKSQGRLYTLSHTMLLTPTTTTLRIHREYIIKLWLPHRTDRSQKTQKE